MVTAEGLSCSLAHLHGQVEWSDGVGASPACTSGGHWSGSRSRAAPASSPAAPGSFSAAPVSSPAAPGSSVRTGCLVVLRQGVVPQPGGPYKSSTLSFLENLIHGLVAWSEAVFYSATALAQALQTDLPASRLSHPHLPFIQTPRGLSRTSF